MQQLLLDSTPLLVLLTFLFALLVGSFLNVVIYRLPIMMERDWREQASELLSTPAENLPEGRFDLMAPRSRCPSCGAGITAMQNIPVLSYLLLRGKCGTCSAGISKRYPIIEFVTALLSAVVAWRFGWGWETAAGIGMTWALIAMSMIDVDHQIIPDSISLPLLWAGLVVSLFHPLPGASVLFIEPRAAIVGAVAGYLSLWSMYQVYPARHRQGRHGLRRFQVARRAGCLARLADAATDYPPVGRSRCHSWHRADRYPAA